MIGLDTHSNNNPLKSVSSNTLNLTLIMTTMLKVTRKEGTLELVSYDEKVVMECQANALRQRNATFDDFSSSSSTTSTTANTTWNSTDESCSTTVPVGLYYNDVWEYDLNCTRQAS